MPFRQLNAKQESPTVRVGLFLTNARVVTCLVEVGSPGPLRFRPGVLVPSLAGLPTD